MVIFVWNVDFIDLIFFLLFFMFDNLYNNGKYDSVVYDDVVKKVEGVDVNNKIVCWVDMVVVEK